MGQELHALPLMWGAQCSVFSILQHPDITDIFFLIGNITVKRRLILFCAASRELEATAHLSA